MMKAFLNYKTLHPQFKLNGVSYNFDSLKELAYRLAREGKGQEKHIGSFLNDWLNETTEVTVKTSGSTGTPKTVLLKKQHMVNSAIATGKFFDLQKGATALLCLPTQYIAGKMMLVRALVLGLALDYVEPTSNPLQRVQKEYDFCAMIPLQLQNSLAVIERIDKLIVGGAQMSTGLKKQIQEKSTNIYETYGMTETITHVAIKKVNNIDTVRSRGAENYFVALPDVSFSKDERDCLVINAPKASSNPIVTNDMVHLVSDTEFEWLGRFDNVINSGGVKLFPEQIEAKLASFMDNPFFVTGIPDEELGQQLILVVEGSIDSENMLLEIQENGSLDKFEIPKAFYQLPNFKRTDTGKIRRKETLDFLKS